MFPHLEAFHSSLEEKYIKEDYDYEQKAGTHSNAGTWAATGPALGRPLINYATPVLVSTAWMQCITT